MREILFRGKRVDNGEKVESNSIQQLYGGSKVYLWYQGEWIEVVYKTVCEYTGLTDKNGRKIFEGDIVKWSGNTETYICHWKDASFKIEDRMGNAVKTTQDAIDYLCLEIIGNIHDNPELLEEVEK